MSTCGGSCEGTLDNLWCLHELFSDLIEPDDLLLHVIELCFKHGDILLDTFIVRLECHVFILTDLRGLLQLIMLLLYLVQLDLLLLVLVLNEVPLFLN